MTPPWFVRLLPQRAAALASFQQFAAEENEPGRFVETYDGRRTVMFVGTARDGREFGIGYEWTPDQLRRYVPPLRRASFASSGARWPADVLVPLRRIARGQG